ncbi:MAG TPA: hypothetical protein VEC08_06025 [Nitrososphaerales archaeon]|nr:hypothetical protein [Nitrososphaerales archaeon]
MPELIIKFACGRADNRAEEFQRHLVSRKIVSAEVGHEVRGSEVWLNFPSLQNDSIKRIEEEARHWCLDRGLGLMQSSDESGRTKPVVLMIGDLAQMVD